MMARKPGSTKKNTKSTTSKKKRESNKRNAQASTGPRTPEGKAAARLNAYKHGATASPAIALAEDPEQYASLLADVTAKMGCNDEAERVLIERIAHCLWQLRRVIQAETAITTQAARQVPADADRVLAWRNRLQSDWEDKLYYREPVHQSCDPGEKPRMGKGDRPYYKQGFRREGLKRLDEVWDELRGDPYGIKAIIAWLDELTEILEYHPHDLSWTQSQQLAWILGESAERVHLIARTWEDEEGCLFPDEQPWASPIDKAIGELRVRTAKGGDAFFDMHKKCQDALVQRYHASMPVAAEHQNILARGAALLPSKEVLDRLLRYESHATKTLRLTIQTLADMRGISLERVVSMTNGGSQSTKPIAPSDAQAQLPQASLVTINAKE